MQAMLKQIENYGNGYISIYAYILQIESDANTLSTMPY